MKLGTALIRQYREEWNWYDKDKTTTTATVEETDKTLVLGRQSAAELRTVCGELWNVSSGSWGIQDKTDERCEMVGAVQDKQYARSCVS